MLGVTYALSGFMDHVSVLLNRTKILLTLLSVMHVNNIRNKVMRNCTVSAINLMMIDSKFCYLKVVWVGGSNASILTSYLEFAGLFIPGVKFSSNSVQPLQRYYNIQTQSKLGMENLNLQNPSHLMT